MVWWAHNLSHEKQHGPPWMGCQSHSRTHRKGNLKIPVGMFLGGNHRHWFLQSMPTAKTHKNLVMKMLISMIIIIVYIWFILVDAFIQSDIYFWEKTGSAWSIWLVKDLALGSSGKTSLPTRPPSCPRLCILTCWATHHHFTTIICVSVWPEQDRQPLQVSLHMTFQPQLCLQCKKCLEMMQTYIYFITFCFIPKSFCCKTMNQHYVCFGMPNIYFVFSKVRHSGHCYSCSL